MNMIIKKEIVVVNKLGLHLRAAALLVQTSNKFKSEIIISVNDNNANGKSIMSIMALAASYGTKIKITATGIDAKSSLDEMCKLVENKFGEKE